MNKIIKETVISNNKYINSLIINVTKSAILVL